jgi:hypothetical protein
MSERKSLSKNRNQKSKEPVKKPKFDNDRKKKELEKQNKKQEQKDEQYKKLEAYINESGLTLAFNIIFAELISKQILPENFFTYTAMRLKQIGKEIEGMNTKVPIYVDKTKTDENGENQNKGEGDENKNDEDNVFMTAQKNK